MAAEPDIHKPMNLAFDDRGRLWVTESVEYPFAAAAGRHTTPDAAATKETNLARRAELGDAEEATA